MLISSTQWSIDMASKASKQVADSLCKLSATSYERSSACLAALPACCLLLAHRGCKANRIAPVWSLLDLLYKKYFGVNNTMHRLVLWFVKI
jgi:hypothetical protein